VLSLRDFSFFLWINPVRLKIMICFFDFDKQCPEYVEYVLLVTDLKTFVKNFDTFVKDFDTSVKNFNAHVTGFDTFIYDFDTFVKNFDILGNFPN